MKKKSAFVMVLALLVMMAAGCGQEKQESKYVGLWQATRAEQGGVSVSVEDVYGKMTLELEDNGKATITTAHEKASDSWKESDRGVTLRFNGEKRELERVKDNVIAGDFGGIKISFERVEEE